MRIFTGQKHSSTIKTLNLLSIILQFNSVILRLYNQDFINNPHYFIDNIRHAVNLAPHWLPPHPGLAGRVSTWLLEYLDVSFIAVDDRAFQHPITHQTQQRLQVFDALDDPAHQV
jgi:hypothetical protein